jgi:L(+)-tartrate dehydratase alpha subunit
MGFAGTSMVVATHVELAYTHTGGMPIGIHQFCLSSRRATARLHPNGRVEFRSDPEWFTDYYRRVGIE